MRWYIYLVHNTRRIEFFEAVYRDIGRPGRDRIFYNHYEEERVYIRERLRHDMLMPRAVLFPRIGARFQPVLENIPGWHTWRLHRSFHESVAGRWMRRHKCRAVVNI